MKEESTNEVDFPDDTCLAFNLFFLWIYFEEAPMPSSHEEVFAAMNAWILADKLCMCDWQNVLVDGIMGFWKKAGMDPGHLAWLCDHAKSFPRHERSDPTWSRNPVRGDQAADSGASHRRCASAQHD